MKLQDKFLKEMLEDFTAPTETNIEAATANEFSGEEQYSADHPKFEQDAIIGEILEP